MPNRSALTATAIVAAVLLLAAGDRFLLTGRWKCDDGSWRKEGRTLESRPKAACAPKPVPPTVCDPPWSCGALSRFEPGHEGTWMLKYNDVAGPAMLEIEFAEGATCSVNGAPVDCLNMNPPSDTGSSFRGKKIGDTFFVNGIDFMKR